ncbi:hypothetical protein ABZ281_22075, partial [Streptomyces sp. NPDC006265]
PGTDRNGTADGPATDHDPGTDRNGTADGPATDHDPGTDRNGTADGPATGQGSRPDQKGAAGRHSPTRTHHTAPGPRDAAAAAARAARPPFLSVTIRTACDAVTATALYLRWLGYRGVRRADQQPPCGIGLAARGVVAQVDPTVRPATLRDVECLWLTAMTESADCLYFSLVGYADDARVRADALGVPLFVLDLTGTPRPVNVPAETLAATGAGQRTP